MIRCEGEADRCGDQEDVSACAAELFRPDPRNRGRQKYCAKSACRQTSKAASQRRWLEKPENQGYFCGPTHVERVRTWRAAHPGYWRRGGPESWTRYKIPLPTARKPLKDQEPA